MFIVLGDQPDPTLILALFHTTFNLILALLWAPWLKPLIRFLQYIFPRKVTDLHLEVEHISTTLPEEILPALSHDVGVLLEKVMHYNRASLMLDGSAYRTRFEQYNELKQIEENLLEHVVLYTTYQYTPTQARSLHLLHDAIVDSISSSKYVKDVAHHLENLKDNSLENTTATSYAFFQTLVKQTTDTIYERQTADYLPASTTIQEYIGTLRGDNDTFIGSLSKMMTGAHDEDLNIAEIIKSHHYILLSCETLLQSYMKLGESTKTHDLAQ